MQITQASRWVTMLALVVGVLAACGKPEHGGHDHHAHHGADFAKPAVASAAATVTLGAITISEPWTWAPPPGANVGGAFMTLANAGESDDKLIRAASPVAAVTEIHTHVMDSGVAKMRAIDTLTVGSKARVELKPGSFHIMLFDLKHEVKVGDVLPVTLTFEKAGAVEVRVPVVEQRPGK